MEKRVARISWPVASQVFLEQLHTANELKLIVGLHYLASNTPDIEKPGPDQNIFNLAPGITNYGPWELAPKWKKIKGENWNDILRSIGFDTTNAQRLKEALEEKLTRIPINPFTMKHKGEKYTVTLRGINLIVLEKIARTKDGKLKEFNIYVGGHTPIIKKWWQAISPSLLYYEEAISVPTWKFIICLGGTIRSDLVRIQKKLKSEAGLPYHRFAMNIDKVEKNMGIADQSITRKAEHWKEVITVLGKCSLGDMVDFPPKKIQQYDLGDFLIKSGQGHAKAQGFRQKGRNVLVSKEYFRELRMRQKALMAKRIPGMDSLGFLLDKKRLSEWLPLKELKEGEDIDLNGDEYESD